MPQELRVGQGGQGPLRGEEERMRQGREEREESEEESRGEGGERGGDWREGRGGREGREEGRERSERGESFRCIIGIVKLASKMCQFWHVNITHHAPIDNRNTSILTCQLSQNWQKRALLFRRVTDVPFLPKMERRTKISRDSTPGE